MVYGVISRQDQLRYGHQGVPLADEVFQDSGQGLGGVLGGVVEKNNRPRLDFGGHPLGNVPGGQVLPVQRINVRRGFKDVCFTAAESLFYI